MSNNKQSDDCTKNNLNRRQFLLMSAAGAGAMAIQPTLTLAQEKVNSKAHIVIAGAGAAGLSCASRLADALEGAKITIIDARKRHLYQPGFTLVAGGIKSQQYPISQTAEYIPDNVHWIEDNVAEFNPESNQVITNSGEHIAYDFLIIATGLKLDYAAIDGMDEKLIGKNGLGSIYHSPEAAAATWQLLDQFADKGGDGLFFRPATEMKCAGAPLKYTFITDDHLRRRGNREKAKLTYNAHSGALFAVPIVAEKVRMLFEDRGIDVHHHRVLRAIDPTRRTATFDSKEGQVQLPYDFINVVPPMRAPDAVRNSALPWQEGKWAADGWVEVDPFNLRHKRFDNIFAVGDIAGVPKGKTAASVKWQVPVAVHHLLAALQGKEGSEIYNGYTSCPLITRLGRAMLVEFDYHNNLTPSFPGVIAPLEELWISWVIKTMALKPTYITMLRGKA